MQGENEYREALKIGQREVLAAPVKSESTTLPVLDNIISSDKVSAAIHIGVEQIPMNLIVGTKTEGRVNAFSPGFMPLLPEDTEFAAKWKSLYDSTKVYAIRSRFTNTFTGTMWRKATSA